MPPESAVSLRKPGTEQLHLWVVRPGRTSVEDLASALSPDELHRASRFRFEKNRREFVVSRSALRKILAAYTGVGEVDLTFQYGPNGKPALAGDLNFNVSHASGATLVAISMSTVGVDIEVASKAPPDWQAVAHHFYSLEDREFIYAQPESERTTGFLKLWTRREAYVKARGLGLDSARSITTVADRLVDEDGRHWVVHSPEFPDSNYIVAVAVATESDKLDVTVFEWEHVGKLRFARNNEHDIVPTRG